MKKRPHLPHKSKNHILQKPLKLKATVDKNRKGFGFLIYDLRSMEDGFIPPLEMAKLFHGDRVEVILDASLKPTKIKVLQHRFREMVGTFSPPNQLVYERKKAQEIVLLTEGYQSARRGDWLRIELKFDEQSKTPVTGKVLKNYGQILPAEADLPMVAGEYNLIEEHSPEAVEEAKSKSLKFDDPHRVDLRHVPFITIDGETARDFDDAVYVEKVGSEYLLWVAIADVSHYVTQGSALDKEALSRGTSVYFPERAFHMLPRELSENLCSLRPHEPRLVFVSKIWFDQSGNRKRVELVEAVIESKRRATYNQIQEEWLKDGKNKDFQYKAHFELFKILRDFRLGRGSIDFELPEAKVIVDPLGEPLEITKNDRFEAHKLIEEFMVAANEAVTAWALKHKHPFLYRIHDDPDQSSIQRFYDLAYNSGIKIPKKQQKTSLAQSLCQVLAQLQNHPSQSLLNLSLLRSMKQARYSANHGTHFGLASEGYTHFTSPIRRYPDLVVHRMLRHALRLMHQKKALTNDLRENLQEQLENIAEHCSYRERVAADADREAIKLKQVRMVSRYVGHDFGGKIISLIERGFFVELDDPYIEGMVSLEDINDDYYVFDETKMVIYGRRTRKQFKIGDRVEIRIAGADLITRRIDFELKSSATKNHSKHSKQNIIQPRKKSFERDPGERGRMSGSKKSSEPHKNTGPDAFLRRSQQKEKKNSGLNDKDHSSKKRWGRKKKRPSK